MEKKKMMITVGIALLVLSLTCVTTYYRYRQAYYVESNDARVDGDIVHISPQITGKIADIYVAEGDSVRAGDTIARQLDLSLASGANLDLTVMKSPVNGTVIHKIANVGEIGSPGQPIVMVCDLTNLFVTAEIEETDLRKVQTGQEVDFSVDAFPGVKFTGRVASIGTAGTSAFSLLPAQNTGGGYTKVVQRIPVRISINDYQGCRLAPGLNVVVKIHITG